MWTTSPFVTRPDREGVPLVLGFGRPRNTGTAVEGTPTSNSAAIAASGVARIDFFGAGLGSRQAMRLPMNLHFSLFPLAATIKY